MVTGDDLVALREAVRTGVRKDHLDRLIARAAPVLERMPVVPDIKAQLSTDGGICPGCAAPLAFDPWTPDRHRCPDCGAEATGDRHHGHWARAQHLWIAERAAHLATIAALTDDARAADRARALLAAYYQRYFELPNRDNVLGPTHLFFSTYLESIWLLDYLAAAVLLRERGLLDEADVEAVNAIADEAANLIGEFDEGLSNRQTWHAAALTAVAVWFGDDELAQTAIGGRTGLLGHLTDGFGGDGMWHEGENYHLFAIRGLLIGLDWARAAGADLTGDPRLAGALGRALLAPATTALPDGTFPARQDARFGVSLAHPAYLECWEVGLARLGDDAPAELAPWLESLYRLPAATAQTYDAYLHDAAEPARQGTTRLDLSWWALLSGREDVAPSDEAAETAAPSRWLPGQGLAILRHADRYASLECGRSPGGHGHPDRLHLTVFAAGVPWLADPGTGSYVRPDLHWYRSTLAHNAPRLDRQSQSERDARGVAFEERGEWGWMVGEWEGIRRTVIAGPRWILDILDVPAGPEVELPWHLDGEVVMETAGTWSPTEVVGEQVTGGQIFAPADGADPVLRATRDGRSVRLLLVGGTVVRAEGPGRPGQPRRSFHLVRAAAPTRLVAVLDLTGTVATVLAGSDRIEVVETTDATTTIRLAAASARIEGPEGEVSLGGALPAPVARKPFLSEKPIVVEGQAIRVDEPPPLDGTVEGFDTSAPLEMADEGHYYRSEEPYDGPETCAAAAFVNWDASHLYLAVDVSKPEVIVRGRNAAPLGLDNEPDDIHSDGIQVYYRLGDAGPVRAYLIRPAEDGGVLARPIPGGPDQPVALVGGSAIGESGYTITVALPCPELEQVGLSTRLAFDLCVNEMRPERVRRAGQLAWGGGNGWVYLRGDRRDPARWGALELIG